MIVASVASFTSLSQSLLAALVLVPLPKPLLFYNCHASPQDNCCLFDQQI